METKTRTRKTETHEEFVAEVKRLAIERALERATITPEQAERLTHTKLVYGLGDGSYRGVCHYKAWTNGIGQVDVIEIAATAEESWVQLAGTTIHELGHALAEWGAGHGPAWKGAADLLGLRKAKAAGMRYTLAAIEPKLRERVAAVAENMVDGSPAFQGRAGQAWLGLLGRQLRRPGGCTAGTGTRGGTSRGAGSGSRLIKVTCPECGYNVRVTRVWLSKGAPFCGQGHGRMVEAGAKGTSRKAQAQAAAIVTTAMAS